MSYNPTVDELETNFGQTKRERSEGVWHFYTNDPFWINRLKARGCVIEREDSGELGGMFGTIEHRQITLRSSGKKTRPKGLRKTPDSVRVSSQL